MILIRHGQSEFNVVYGATRRDPGIPDPCLTAEGRDQARAAALALADRGIRRLLSSPYSRALETAAIIAETLAVPITIEPLVRERYAFSCDIGRSPEALARQWPMLDFAALDSRWWCEGGAEETETALAARGVAFRQKHGAHPDWRTIAVVTHWGFIRTLTGVEPSNGQIVSFDPTLG